MSKLKRSAVYIAVAIATTVSLESKWQSLGVSDQSCVRPIGMGLVEFVPNCQSGPDGWTTNSLGIRAEEPGARAAESVYTVLYLGWADSQIAAVENSSLMTATLQQQLNSTGLHRLPIRVIDGSGPGIGGISRFQHTQKLIKAYRPQLIVYLFVPRSEHIQYAALQRLGAVESPYEMQRDLIRFSWIVKMDRDPVDVMLGATISDLRELTLAAGRENSKLVVVWPGIGLAFSSWYLRLSQTLQGLAIRVTDALKIATGSSAGRIRLLLGDNQIQYHEAFDLGALFARRMAFSESEQRERSMRVADRLAETIKREGEFAER